MSRFPPVGTDEFDGLECSLDDKEGFENRDPDIQTKPKNRSGKTHHFVASLTAASIAGAIGLTGIYGLAAGDWEPLKTVWTITAAPVGAALAILMKSL